jgi:hypothetical protein
LVIFRIDVSDELLVAWIETRKKSSIAVIPRAKNPTEEGAMARRDFLAQLAGLPFLGLGSKAEDAKKR